MNYSELNRNTRNSNIRIEEYRTEGTIFYEDSKIVRTLDFLKYSLPIIGREATRLRTIEEC